MLPLAPPALSARAPVVSIPFEPLGSLIVVRGTVDGKPVRLVLDTCAGINLLTPDTAKSLGLQGGVAIPVGGAGETARSANLVFLKTLACGGQALGGQPAVVMELPAAGGKRADGILGMPFLSKFVVTIDYAAKTVSFRAPGAPSPKDAAALPMTIRQGLPEVPATVDGLSGQVRVDSGYGGTFSFTSPTVERERLVAKYPKRIETITGQGLGGATRGDALRLGGLTLGNVTLSAPIAYLARDRSGALADSGTIGLLGGEALSRFTATFDFPGKTLYLKKNADFDRPFPFGRTGFSGTFDEDGAYKVALVTPDSPASEAGIAVGETVVSVDGKSPLALTSGGMRDAFRREPGARVVVKLKSTAGVEREVTLKLRDLL